MEKLGDHNDYIWKHNILLFISFSELNEHIYEGIIPPVDPEGIHDWDLRDEKSRAIIGLSLNEEQTDHVR